MKKYKLDLILVIGLIAFACISWIAVKFFYNSNGNYVEIFVDGKIQDVYSLDKDGEYEIRTADFINVIQIKDGQVSMKEADCPDQLCIKQGKINKDGQSIICLPHKIVVKVTSDQEDKVDAYAK